MCEKCSATPGKERRAKYVLMWIFFLVVITVVQQQNGSGSIPTLGPFYVGPICV